MKSKKGERGTIQNPAIDFLKSDQAPKLVESNRDTELSGFAKDLVGSVVRSSKQCIFSHWELEFPEVFFEKAARKPTAGFDTVFGNPPYGSSITRAEAGHFRDVSGVDVSLPDYYIAFIVQAHRLLCHKGRFGYIVPSSGLAHPDMPISGTTCFAKPSFP